LHPEERRKVEEEVDRVLSGRTPSIEDVPHLVFTRQVIDESLRLYPPAWAIGRQTIDEDIIGGYPIPAKSGIIISTYIVHRHPDFWENPEGFDPQRFTPERARERPRYAFLPFGGGPRQCIGNNFALLESTLVLAMITQRFRLNLVSGHPVEMEPLITLRPRYGILVTIHPR
jgi:cytochrome P450